MSKIKGSKNPNAGRKPKPKPDIVVEYINKKVGRKPGSPNKITGDLREIYRDMLIDISKSGVLVDTLNELLKTNPKEALNFLLSLNKFVIPELTKSEVKTEFTQTMDYSQLSIDELNKLEDITKNIKLNP